MKKILGSLPQLLLVTAVSLTIGCNSGSSTEETSTTSDTKGNSPGINLNPTITGDSAGLVNTPSNNDANAVMTDTGFISKNIVDNMMEIQLSKMGRDKSKSADVKRAANLMITDHTQMLNDLRSLAGKKQVSIPATATGHHMGDTSALSSLRTTSGTDFDNSWTGHMLTMHQAKVTELENALNQTQDADIIAAINKALPKVRNHVEVLTKITSTPAGTR